MTQPVSTPLPTAITSTNAPDNNVRIGTVTQVAPLRVSVQGGNVESPGVLFGATFSIGDIVSMLRQDQSWLALGTVATSGLATITGPVSFSGAAPSFSTTSSGFANYHPGANKDWVKRLPNSLVRVDISASCFSTVAATKAEFGLQLLGASSFTASGPAVMFQVINTNLFGSNHTFLAGVPVGSYSARPLLRRSSGTGTITTDGNDWLSFTVQEVTQ